MTFITGGFYTEKSDAELYKMDVYGIGREQTQTDGLLFPEHLAGHAFPFLYLVHENTDRHCHRTLGKTADCLSGILHCINACPGLAFGCSRPHQRQDRNSDEERTPPSAVFPYHGKPVGRTRSNAYPLTSVICKSLPALLTVTVQFAAAAYMMAAMDWRILLCIVFLMPIAVVAGKIHFRKIRSLSRNILDTGSKVQSHIQENIQHRTLMSTMEMVPEMSGELSSIQSSLEKQVMERTDYSLFSKTIVQLGFSAGYLTVFIWCITGLMNGSMTFGMMTAFIQLVSQIQRPVVDMGRILPSAMNAAVSAERLSELLELPAEDSVPAVRFGNTAGIRFDNVSFSYKDGDGGKEIISGFSHDFRPGSITAVTGETGAGKSTLVRLILALTRPDKGKVIFYDGAKSAEASSGTRCNIIYVPQGNSLISGTIRTNLLLGKPDATDEEMLAALHNAVADFVLELPEGLDTTCSESGRGLSEGQAQRIAIARGMLREGGIIILDEPTSALDGDTEQTLLSRLAENSCGKTIIIVSHSDTVAQFCHDIIRLERNSD